MDIMEDKRKNYFIKKSFQAKFILRFCSLVILAAVVLGCVLFSYVYFKGTVTTAFVDSRLSIVTTADYILPILIAASIIAVVLVGVATIATVKYLSHRIAGPLFSLERSIDRIADGDLSLSVNLRSTDEIRKMAEVLSDMNNKLREHVRGIKTSSSELSKDIELLVQGEANASEVKEIAERLKNKQKDLDLAINYFKVD